jgi:photosystem II stability/assembly factor-like uncharacterized protein
MKKIFILGISLLTVSCSFAQWVSYNTNPDYQLRSVYFVDGDQGYAVGLDDLWDYGIFLQTLDGGIEWATKPAGTDNYNVFFTAKDTGYIGSIGEVEPSTPTLLRTSDGGASFEWQYLPPGITRSVFFLDADTGFAAGSYWGGFCLYKTVNGGDQWDSKQTGTGLSLHAVFFPNHNTGYAVGTNGTVIKTSNGGSEWTLLDSVTSFNLNSVFFTDECTGYIAGGVHFWPYNSILLKTADCGLTWTKLTSGTSNGLNSVYFTDMNTGYAVGDFGTIIKTLNGGQDWFQQASGTTETLYSVYFPARDTGYIVGSNGTILKTINGGGLPVGINERPLFSESLNIFPNPASTIITISLPTTVPFKNATLTIYNVNAQKVISQSITEPQTVIDISALPGGIYFVRIFDEKEVMTGKFIKH